MTKMIVLSLLLLIPIPFSAIAQEDTLITHTYTTADGRLQFDYPDGWIVDEDVVWQFIMVTAEFANPDLSAPSFSLVTMACPLVEDVSGLVCPNTDFESLIRAYLEEKMDFYGFTLLQAPILLDLASHPAMVVQGRTDSPNDADSADDYDMLTIVVGLTDSDFAVLEGFTPVGEMANFEDIFIHVADSLLLYPMNDIATREADTGVEEQLANTLALLVQILRNAFRP